jgi:sugar phosphate isomerase/epimerase
MHAKHSRRDFLAAATAAAAPACLARTAYYDPRLAVHTQIWLQEARRRNLPLTDILDQAFSGTHRAGYARVELMWDFLVPLCSSQTLKLLKKYKLEASVLAVQAPLFPAGAAAAARAQVVETATMMRRAGTQAVSLTLVAGGSGARTEEQLRCEAVQLVALAEQLSDLGMGLLLHPDVSELRDARAWRFLLAHTEPSLVSLCLDLDSALRAGQDPIRVLKEAGNRLGSLHLRNSRRGDWLPELADGDIDLPGVARILRQMFYTGFLIVELMQDPGIERRESIPMALYRSRRYMQDVFGQRPGYLPVDMGPHVRVKGL